MKEQSGTADWRRITGVMVGVSFIAFIGFSFVMPFLPLYFAELGVRDPASAALWAGVTLATAPLCAGLTAPLWGLLADRHGVKRIVLVGMIAYVVLLVVLSYVTAPWQVVVGWAAMGLFGGFTSLSLGLVAVVAPRGRVTMAVGLIQAGQILGTAMGPALGGLAAERSGMRGSFIVAAVLTALAASVLVLLLPEVRVLASSRNSARGPQGLRGLRETLRLPGFATILGVLLLARGIERTLDPVLPLYVGQLQSTGVAATTGLIAMSGTLATAVASVAVSRLVERWSATRLLTIALLGGALTCVPLALVANAQQLLALRVVWGLFAGGIMTLAFASGGLLLPPERRGGAFGLLGSATYYGMAGGTFMAGLLASFHLQSVFFVDAILYLAALVWLNRPAARQPRVQQSVESAR